MSRSWSLLIPLFVALPTYGAAVKTQHSRVELIAEQASLPAQGGAATLGVFLAPDPGWHAYWVNPGDAGKEPSVRWTLPAGVEAGELAFPAPHLIPFGPFNTYGFNEGILLTTTLTVPSGLVAGEAETIAAKARWVVCDDELCVPEQANLTLTLPIGDGASDANHAARFAAARAKLPERVDWPARFALADGRVEFEVTLPEDLRVTEPYLFVAAKRLVEYGEQGSLRTDAGLRFDMLAGRRADRAQATAAVLRFTDAEGGERAAALEVERADAPLPPAAARADGGAAPAGASFELRGLMQALAFGLLGGIVLNLMPCVFPILSMKALGLVQLAGGDRREARLGGLLYAAGVLLAFLVAAAALVALREAGNAVGWGFHLQSPLVNAGLGLLMVAIGLNLGGVFEIGARLMGVGQSATVGGERRAAFFTGLLAVVVATPCTAPFMAGALGYALAQPVVVALAVFMALGFGLALPYLALTFVPAIGRVLPKPGPWMDVFRRALAFPMYATALWLFWVVGQQLGATSMAIALLAALLLAFALWAFGGSAAGGRVWGWRATALAGAVGCAFAISQVTTLGEAPAGAGRAGAAAHRLGKLEVQPFSPELVERHVTSDQPVFVYFTADWCISCKVNERVALASDRVGDAMSERGITVVEGDWTAEDPVITTWLARYGRAGVPLYLYFPAGSSLESAVVLPQVLLPETVIGAIDAADRAA